MFGFINYIDMEVLKFVNRYLSAEYIHTIFNLFTYFGYFGIGWVVILMIYSFRQKDRKLWLFWGISFTLNFLICEVFLKNTVRRDRPFMQFPDLKIDTVRTPSFSFPSGHASFSGASLYILSCLTSSKGINILWFILSILVSVSRVVLKVHFLSDVVAGYMIGLLIGFIMRLILFKTGRLEQVK